MTPSEAKDAGDRAVSYKYKLPLVDTISHLETLAQAVRAGALTFVAGGNSVSLKPGGVLEVTLKAGREDDEERISLRVKWQYPPASALNLRPVVPAARPPEAPTPRKKKKPDPPAEKAPRKKSPRRPATGETKKKKKKPAPRKKTAAKPKTKAAGNKKKRTRKKKKEADNR
jgi:amphi-Trp domain-containing protein